ncbi:MAG: tungsten ABC transporter substrate-binding protein [Desulfobacteraceae bacterium]|nr:MAG: tungsten ABC transporter substrate-binding protein [Desulfobacteraceae bacterium]
MVTTAVASAQSTPAKADGNIKMDKVIKMSTTTSTQDSGLLDVLLPAFEKDTGIQVKVIAKGTGAAIRDGIDGNVDIIFVHAKKKEEKFVADGFGTKRYAVMHNDFVIAGPKKDPAGIIGLNNGVSAFEKIAQTKSTFISRGDDSGTHTKEQDIWGKTKVKMVTQTKEIIKDGKPFQMTFTYPDGLGQWYLSIGQGMGPTLTMAAEKQAYTLTDRGTYIKFKDGRREGLDLEILCEGDASLLNPYGLIPVNPAKHPHVRFDLAQKFADWMMSAKGQSMIKNYTIFGKPLFFPDAINE